LNITLILLGKFAFDRKELQFNNRRLLEPIGNIPPAEFEKQYYQQTSESAMVA